MHLIVHVNGFYEWVEVPKDVERNTPEWERAVKAGKIKPVANGVWSMQVPKKKDSWVEIAVNEEDVIQCIIQEMTRGDRKHLTRVQAVTRLMARHTVPQMAHSTHVEEFQIGSDDGPDEKLFKKLVGEHVDCHNIDPLDFDGLLAAYMTPATIDDHHDSLHAHYEVAPERLESFRARRLETEATLQAARQHHRARLEAGAQKDDEVKP